MSSAPATNYCAFSLQARRLQNEIPVLELAQKNWGSDAKCWNFLQGLKFKTDFTHKWASVDTNWGLNSPSPFLPRQFQHCENPSACLSTCPVRLRNSMRIIDVKTFFTFFYSCHVFYVFNVFYLSTFLFLNNVHWKFHKELQKALLKQQKRIKMPRKCLDFIMKTAECRAALYSLRYAVPIATRLLWRHAINGASTWSRELNKVISVSSSRYRPTAPTALGIIGFAQLQ